MGPGFMFGRAIVLNPFPLTVQLFWFQGTVPFRLPFPPTGRCFFRDVFKLLRQPLVCGLNWWLVMYLDF